MVFNAIHGVDEKDPSTVTMPFHFDRKVNLASMRVGVDPNAPKEFVDRLRELGMRTKDIGARPVVAGAGAANGGLNVEYAAAFDDYVQRKAKETGLDLNAALNAPPPAAGGGRGADSTARAAAAAALAANPMAPADWNPRFVTGRAIRGLDFMQSQRRRYILITKWAEFMTDLDMFIGNPQADVGVNAQTGHPCAVVPYKFDVPQQFGGGGGGRGGPAQPPVDLKPQPIWRQ